MDKTETPGGDNEAGEAVIPTSTFEDGAGAGSIEMKSSISERVLIGIILAVVVGVTIIGVVITLALRPEKGSPINPINSTSYNESVIEDPFEVEASIFLSNSTEPYTSIEDLRKDIEALTKTFVNTVILQEANKNEYDFRYYNDNFFEASIASSPMEEASMTVTGSSAGSFENVDDFETYQHEANVVKDDLVKSNGVFVFSADNNRIEVWDLEGTRFETNTIRSAGSDECDIYIQALLVNPEGNKLIVIASDYRNVEGLQITDSYISTQVTVFDIQGSSLNEISQTYIDGYHVNSYSIGNDVHVVTKRTLNTWNYIENPLSRYEWGDDLTNEEYTAEAKRIADKIIPDFVDEVINLVTEGEEILLSRLVGFPNAVNDYKSITEITSFDTSKINDDDDMELHVSRSLVFRPGNNEHVYATDEWIWVADENLSWGNDGQDYQQQTMLLGFRLDGASSTFAAIGTLSGRLLSQFSIDFVKDDDKEYVRIAVTQESPQSWWLPGNVDSSFLNTDDFNNESRTLNEVVIFEIPKTEDNGQKNNKLVKLGSVELGKKDETITAVRFFDNISYVVTFERTDPFYVLDLSDPMNPTVLGELEVPGFSEFMHPIKPDNSMLLTVGQDANEFGSITGFQISIFDSAIPNDPKLVDRLVVGEEDRGRTSSSSSWDERAFRYIQVGEVGRLIIPLYSSQWDSFGNFESYFDGFSVFGVDLNKTDTLITREIDIDHSQYYQSTYDSEGCYCAEMYLPDRSMVFDGNLMTMKGSKVLSTDLTSQKNQWSLNLKDSEDCCLNC
jgi:hypothetical protein